MAFDNGDRARIVKLLELHRDQVIATSITAQLMTQLETFDANHSTAFVTEVQTLLTASEALQVTIDANAGKDGYTRVDVENEGEIEVAAGGLTQPDKNKLTTNIERIKNLLDPNGHYLDMFATSGRVVRTI